MTGFGRASALAAIAAGLCACTPRTESLELGEQPSDSVHDRAVTVVPTEEPRVAAPPVLQPEPVDEPGPDLGTEVEPEPEPDAPVDLTATPVRPRLKVDVVGDVDVDDCRVVYDANDFPAYDPQADEVVTIEIYQRGLSTEMELTVRWLDGATGKTNHVVEVVEGMGTGSCKALRRRARKGAGLVRRRLAAGAFESMAALPVRVVHPDAYENYRGGLADPDTSPEDDEAFREELMPRGQVHVVDTREATLLRLPGVKVYERFALGGEGTRTLDGLMAHRPSGTVLATQAGCRDEEDCTCNREESSTVMRWATASIAATERHACVEKSDGDGECDIGSVYF